MAELDTKARDKLRSSQFAYVDSKGGEHLPIHDEEQSVTRWARFNQTEFESKTAKERSRKKIVAAAKKHGIEVSDDANVAQPARSGRAQAPGVALDLPERRPKARDLVAVRPQGGVSP